MNTHTTDLPVAARKNVIAELTDDQKKLCNDAAEVIRNEEHITKIAIFKIGSILVDVKKSVGHGHFTDWITREFAMSQKTATNYMSVASTLSAKSETVSNLPATTLYDIAALPDLDRCEIIDMIVDPAHPPVKIIKKRVADMQADEGRKKAAKKLEDAKAAKEAQKSPAARNAAVKRKEDEQQQREAMQRANEEREQKLLEQAKRWLSEIDPKLKVEIMKSVRASNYGYVAKVMAMALREMVAKEARPLEPDEVTPPKAAPVSVASLLPVCDDAVLADEELTDLVLTRAGKAHVYDDEELTDLVLSS